MASDTGSLRGRDTATDDFLQRLSDRLRAARARRGMTRNSLARDAGISQRYLAQLEAGDANPSVAVLRELATAMAMPLAELLADERDLGTAVTGHDTLNSVPNWVQALPHSSPALQRITQLLARLPAHELALAEQLLAHQFKIYHDDQRANRIALIGLRGAGKSTLGQMLAERLNIPFIELNTLIADDYGAPIAELFALSGQAAYRRHERRCLERVCQTQPRAVIATGGGLVANTDTFSFLRRHTYTVWVSARPEEHMSRVIAQGDLRPMASNRENSEAMTDLKNILAAREPLYAQADAKLDTGGKTLAQSADELYGLVKQHIAFAKK